MLEHLETYTEHGLAEEEASQRLEIYGLNQLAEAPPTPFWKRLWDQFNSFVFILSIVASVISAFLGDFVEAAAIMAIVLLNAILGVVQEGARR